MDAIQSLTGCTFGKGNLIHLDYGKNAFTFIRRSDGKAIRIVVKSTTWADNPPDFDELRDKVSQGQASEEERARYQELFAARTRAVLEGPLEEMFDVQAVAPVVPARARLHDSLLCAGCGEQVMETRSRVFRGQSFCIPCFDARDRR